MLARLVDHRGREVDAARMAHHLGEGADHQPRSAGDVEHGVVRAGARKLDQQAQRRLVTHRDGVGERGRLPGELIDHDVGV